MVETAVLGNELRQLGFSFYSGVPCSYLKSLINYALNECEYVMGANEGDSVAAAAGAALGGRKAVFLCQNSGLTNATSPMTSLLFPFRIPILGFVSLRGEPGVPDEPQHQLMGEITPKLLELMQVRWSFLTDNPAELSEQLAYANDCIESGESFFFVVKKGTLGPVDLAERDSQARSSHTRDVRSESSSSEVFRRDVLQELVASRDSKTVLVATTGYTGRELYSIDDHASHFYMVGSMGCVSSLALGIAISQPTIKVIAIDGDGSLLMRMGSLATTGYYRPRNLFHLLVDNGCHESTGGQFTVSPNVDFAGVARASGLPEVKPCSSLDDLRSLLRSWKENPQCTFSSMAVRPGIETKLPRPKVQPAQVAERFRKFLAEVGS